MPETLLSRADGDVMCCDATRSSATVFAGSGNELLAGSTLAAVAISLGPPVGDPPPPQAANSAADASAITGHAGLVLPIRCNILWSSS